MSPGRRREQLLEVGADLFADQTYDEVWIEEVARRAGVSRGLLYHYFPTKWDFFLAVVERNADRLSRISSPRPDGSPGEELRRSVYLYLTSIRTNRHAYQAVYYQREHPSGGDPRILALLDRSLAEHERHILDCLARSLGGPVPGAMVIVVRGWLRYLVAMAVEWLEDPVLSLDDMVELSCASLEDNLRIAFRLVADPVEPVERAVESA